MATRFEVSIQPETAYRLSSPFRVALNAERSAECSSALCHFIFGIFGPFAGANDSTFLSIRVRQCLGM